MIEYGQSSARSHSRHHRLNDLFRRLLEGSQVNVALLTSSVRGKKRQEILEGLKDGSVHVLIGTHAVIEKKVKFARLALAVMDEQHARSRVMEIFPAGNPARSVICLAGTFR